MNLKKSKRKIQIEYSSLDKIDNQSTKKNKILKSKSDKEYKIWKNTSDSDDKDKQNIKKFSKKKTMNRSKKWETYSDPLGIIVISIYVHYYHK